MELERFNLLLNLRKSVHFDLHSDEEERKECDGTATILCNRSLSCDVEDLGRVGADNASLLAIARNANVDVQVCYSTADQTLQIPVSLIQEEGKKGYMLGVVIVMHIYDSY
eukprot:GEZU01036284.1.p1 GENE.GEZU01036284.1~~GEZU01036284.1.p1  ORF type:complete len:111 (-),score=17.03 GEZU01036284.1:80-412(-)